LQKEKKAVAVNRLDVLNLDPCIAAVFEVQVKICRLVFGLKINEEIIYRGEVL
jgi:hypothetical protein